MPSDTTREQLLKKPIDLAEYLFTRLKQLGIDSLHGLPGDYNLVALDYLPKVGLSWVGNCNELNASYAADGYARVKGIGAVLTTFGVGELSALNGIAGAYSERVPVVHIVGTPSTLSQKNGMLLHHTLGNGNFKVFADMSKELACATANLRDPYDAAGQIDHVLEECWRKSLPVYITLPTDMVQKKVEGEKLDTPLDLSFPPNNPEQEDYAVDVILRSLYQAEDPVVLVDACAIRHRVLDEVHEFLEKTKIPVYVTPMGKGAIDETIDQYAGVYAGEGSQPQVREKFESADLVIRIGSIASDFNTSGFSYKTSQLNIIDLHSSHVAVRYSHYPGTHFKGVLQKMTKKIDLSKLSIKTPAKVRNAVKENDDGTPTITQDYLWPRVGEFFKENDVVVTETGTANFGIWDSLFPSGVTALSQVLWGSIGWSVGACQGAAQAVKDNGSNRRVILFVGDGSFQLTVQELSTMLRRGLKPIIFVICNDGYEIERCIHGETAEYNFISNWKYKDLVNTFRGEDVGAKTFQVKTKDELEKLLTDKEFNAAKVLQFVELYLPKKNAPRALVLTAERAAANNARVE